MKRLMRLAALCGFLCAQFLPTLRAESPEIEALKNDLADCRADRKKGIKRNCHWYQQEIKRLRKASKKKRYHHRKQERAHKGRY